MFKPLDVVFSTEVFGSVANRLKCHESFRLISLKLQAGQPEVSWKFPGNFRLVSLKFHADQPETLGWSA